MDQINFEEVSRRPIKTFKPLETTINWGQGPLSVITNKGLSMFEFSYDLSLWNKNIELLESAIPTPKTSPASKLLVSATKGRIIDNLNFNQMIIDPVFWPYNEDLMKELAAVTAHESSPPEFLFNNDCFLATLTNMGNINFFVRKRHCWADIFDLSALLEDTMNLEAKLNFCDKEKLLDPLREASSTLQSCAFCWGSYNPSNKSCLFVTAQRNGDILFWKIVKKEDCIKGELISKHHIETSEIVSIHFISRTDQKFLLIFSNILGQLNSLECTVENESITVTKMNVLWKHQDRMNVSILKHKVNPDGNIQCLFAKHRHLIIQVLKDNGELISQYHNNVNDNKITGMFKYKSDFYLCTENFCGFKIVTTQCNENISAQFLPIIIKDDNAYSMHNLYGIAVSRNEAFWALAVISRKVESRNKPQNLNVVFLTPENDKNSMLEQLLNSPTKSLREMWDCIELQRYKSLKSKSFPDYNYNKMFSKAQVEPHLLKLYNIYLNLHKNFEVLCNFSTRDLLPETSCVKVKELLMFQHATTLVKNLFSKFKNGNELKYFEEESFTCAKHYIEYYCQKYKCDMKAILSTEIIQKEAKCNSKWICELCNENLEGFSCKYGHVNLFCSLTFTPINGYQYLSCIRCKATARFELYSDNPTCIFCDLYLVVT